MEADGGLQASISSFDKVEQMNTMKVQDDFLRFHGQDEDNEISSQDIDAAKVQAESPELDLADVSPDWATSDERDDSHDYTMEAEDESSFDDRDLSANEVLNSGSPLQSALPDSSHVGSYDNAMSEPKNETSSMEKSVRNAEDESSDCVQEVQEKDEESDAIMQMPDVDADESEMKMGSGQLNGSNEVGVGGEIVSEQDKVHDIEEDLSIGNDEEIAVQPDLDGSTLTLSFDSTLSSQNKSFLDTQASDNNTTSSRFSKEAIEKFREARKASKRGQEYTKIQDDRESALSKKNGDEFADPEGSLNLPSMTKRSPSSRGRSVERKPRSSNTPSKTSDGAFNLSYMNRPPSTRGMSPSPEMRNASRQSKEQSISSSYSTRSSSIPPSFKKSSYQQARKGADDERNNSLRPNGAFNLSFMRKKMSPALRDMSPSPQSRSQLGPAYQRRSQSVTRNSIYRPTTPSRHEKSYLRSEKSSLIGLSFDHRSNNKYNDSSPHQRLYRQGLENEKKKALRTKIELEERLSRKKLDLPTRRFNQRLPSHPNTHDRLYEMGRKVDHEPDIQSVSSNISRRTNPMADMNSTNLRLYEMAMKKKELELEREMIRQQREEELDKIKPKLELATKSYKMMTPRDSPYSSSKDIHSRLYDLAKTKKAEDDLKSILDDNASVKSRKVSPEKLQQKFDRLYHRSNSRIKDGRKRREEIERALAPRAPTPSRKISATQAEGLYFRGMEKLAQMEMKRVNAGSISYESSTILKATESMDYELPSTWSRDGRSQTPSGRGSGQGDFSSRGRAESISRGRGRSVTPSTRGYRGRSRTPMR